MKLNISSIKQTWLLVLLVYHLFFGVLAYYYTLTHGGDAMLYWFQTSYTSGKEWLDFLNIGTDFILLINYPFASLMNLPLWSGFLLYSLIGFCGILQFVRLSENLVGEKLQVKGMNLLFVVYFLPNLHFWTANLGKETLCFLWLSIILLKLQQKEFRSPYLWLSALLLFLLRPHVALMLLLGISFTYLFFGKLKIVTKLYLSLGTLIFGALGYYLFLILSKVKSFNIDKLLYYNEYSILSFQGSGSYVPMLEYSYPMKLFSFYFRPLFLDAENLYSIILSVENLLVLLLHIAVLFPLLVFYKYIKLDLVAKAILLYAFIAGVLYVQRYAGLGIFVRTKIMLQPFVILVLLSIVQQYLIYIKSKKFTNA